MKVIVCRTEWDMIHARTGKIRMSNEESGGRSLGSLVHLDGKNNNNNELVSVLVCGRNRSSGLCRFVVD